MSGDHRRLDQAAKLLRSTDPRDQLEGVVLASALADGRLGGRDRRVLRARLTQLLAPVLSDEAWETADGNPFVVVEGDADG